MFLVSWSWEAYSVTQKHFYEPEQLSGVTLIICLTALMCQANTFRQDNVPCHKAESALQWVSDCCADFLSDWPANCPTLIHWKDYGQ